MKHSNSKKTPRTQKHIKGTTPAIQAASNEAAHTETPQKTDPSGAPSKTKFADPKNLEPKTLHASDFIKNGDLGGVVERLFTCLKGRQKPSHMDLHLYEIVAEILEKKLYLLEKKKDGSPKFPTPDGFIEWVAKLSRRVLREHTSESCQKNSYRQINAAKVFFLLKIDIPDTPIPLETSVLTVLGRCSRGNLPLILNDALAVADVASIKVPLIIKIAEKYGETNLPKPKKSRSTSKEEAAKRWILFRNKASKYPDLADDLVFFTKWLKADEKHSTSSTTQSEEPSASPPAQLPVESQSSSTTSKTETKALPPSAITNSPKPVPQEQPKQAPADTHRVKHSEKLKAYCGVRRGLIIVRGENADDLKKIIKCAGLFKPHGFRCCLDEMEARKKITPGANSETESLRYMDILKDAGVEVFPLPEFASPTEELSLLAGFLNEQSGQATLQGV